MQDALPKALPLLIEVDLVQAEWVVTAYICEDANMLEVIEKKLDPHARTGEFISRAPLDFIIEEHRRIGHETDPDKIRVLRSPMSRRWPMDDYFLIRTMSTRQGGKKSNHGLDYGMEYVRFALETGMREADAKICVERYHNAYPGVRRYHRAVKDKLRTDRTLTNCLGEKITIYNLLDIETMMFAYSWEPQSTVARVTNLGWQRIYSAKPGTPLHKADPLANVHDSITSQALPRCAEELLEICVAVDEAMITPLNIHNRDFVLDREIKVGRTWGEKDMLEVPELTIECVEAVWDRCLSGA